MTQLTHPPTTPTILTKARRVGLLCTMSTTSEKTLGSARMMKRTMSAIQRPGTAIRPFTATSRPRRPYSAYTDRGTEEAGPKYDIPETNREWWRTYVKETPTPGSYQHQGFVEDLHKQKTTYGFRNIGRRPTSAKFYTNGELLIPGAYERKDFVEELNKKSKTYNFRSIERDQGPKIGHGYGDKEMDIDPVGFDLRSSHDKEVQKARNSKDSNFRSQVRRKIESNHQFSIIPTPGPGKYEASNATRPTSASVNSIFKSKVPRFHSQGKPIPGPGTYEISVSDFGDPKPLPAIGHYLKKKAGIPVS